ncbi:MAG: carbohydrate ABC transporter permease [Actinobacteria bacterium]|nr:carbohydrate ABC transporter permease [Actinomycetota bacterium]
MATSETHRIGIRRHQGEGLGDIAGRSGSRRTWGMIGQYALLTLLALVVLGPLVLIVIQALSPPFQYVNAGKPLHPVDVAWKDRTWFTGGFVSVAGRTLVVAFLFAWLHKVARGFSWRDWRDLLDPAGVVAIVGGTLVLAATTSPIFGSLHAADGSTLGLVLLSMALVSATQAWSFIAGERSAALGAVVAILTGVGMVILAVLMAGPAVWTVSWSRYDLGGAMGRSLTMAIIITISQVVTSIMAAYAFVFLRFPFKRILFAMFMATLLLPLEVTLVGNIATIRQLEWTNTMQALVLPFGASALGTFLIRQGFRGLPTEIRDATRLDGYGHVAFLTKFAVPLTRPVVASFTVIAGLQAWNQYLWPRAVIEKNEFNTLQIQLRAVAAGEVANANQAIAAALVAAVPVVILLIAFQRQIIRGLTAGAVK